MSNYGDFLAMEVKVSQGSNPAFSVAQRHSVGCSQEKPSPDDSPALPGEGDTCKGQRGRSGDPVRGSWGHRSARTSASVPVKGPEGGYISCSPGLSRGTN